MAGTCGLLAIRNRGEDKVMGQTEVRTQERENYYKTLGDTLEGSRYMEAIEPPPMVDMGVKIFIFVSKKSRLP